MESQTTNHVNTETMIAIGGSHWTKAGNDRVYINDWTEYAGLEVTRYNTGNISAATYQGHAISNSQAYKILGSVEKVWFDAADGKLHCRYGLTESREVSKTQLFEDIAAGIRSAIAAL